MAAKKPIRKQENTTVTQRPEESRQSAVTSSWKTSSVIPYLIIFLFTMGIYINSVGDLYAIDDTLVLTDNKFTLQGFSGIPDLMTKDAFVGFFGERGATLVAGGRYRPLSIVTLAVEVALTGGLHPGISHFINILLFAFTGLILYRILKEFIPARKDSLFYLTIPFIATMLYVGHPIHTEAVTNIKGRDEVMGMLFSLLALFAALRYVKTNNPLHIIWGAAVYFLALLSKENAITFLAVIPLSLYFFTKAKPQQYSVFALYVAAAGGYLLLRHQFIHPGPESTEILNNPFAYLPKNPDGSLTTDGMLMKYATVVYSFLLYFKLLIFPHPLTHDYYFNEIPFIGVSDPMFIVTLLVILALLSYAVWGIARKLIPAYGILFFFITFSVVSNVFFTVGIIMNERFVYISSLGFCLAIAYLLVRALDKKLLNAQVLTGILVIVLGLYSVKTFSRNMAWHDNLTLFLTDSKISTRSAKVQMSAGGDLDKLADANFDSIRRTGELQHFIDLIGYDERVADVPDSTLKKHIRIKSIEYLDTALAIYPTHSNAFILRGNVRYKLNHDVAGALQDYANGAKYHYGPYYDAWYDMGCVQIENNMPQQAKESFQKALIADPEVFAARSNLAQAYYNLHIPDSAIYWWKKTLELKPLDDHSYYQIGTTYGKMLNDFSNAIMNISKAIECNPKVPLYYEDLAVAYGLANRYDEAIAISQKAISLFPDYLPSYNILAVSYHKRYENTHNQEELRMETQYKTKADALRGTAAK